MTTQTILALVQPTDLVQFHRDSSSQATLITELGFPVITTANDYFSVLGNFILY